jgi:hypothetical protein
MTPGARIAAVNPPAHRRGKDREGTEGQEDDAGRGRKRMLRGIDTSFTLVVVL